MSIKNFTIKTKIQGLSSNRLFYLFIVISLIFSISISIYLVGGHSKSILMSLQKESSQTQSQLTINHLFQFFNTRVKLLQDLAQQPLLANSVMGSSQSLANLNDFFQDYKILGNKESIKLLNILGDVVYSNVGESNNLSSEPWFNQVVEGKKPFIISAHKKQSHTYPILIVPVLYNEFVEGILIVKFSSSLNDLLKSIVKVDSRHGIHLDGKYLSFSTISNQSEYTIINQDFIPATDLKLKYFVHTNSMNKDIKKFMQDIALSILVSLFLSFLVLTFFGRHLLLNPFQQLRRAKRQNDLFVDALNKSPVGLSISDARQPDSPLIYVNSSFLSITGYSEKEVLGSNCRFLQGQETDLNVVKQLSQAIKETRKLRVELINYKKDGTPFWNDLEISPIFDKNNELISYVGVQQDISERVKNAQYLKESQEQLKLIIDSTSVGIWDWQVQSGKLIVNERWADIVGYKLDEIAPINIDTWASFAHPKDLERSTTILNQFWRGEIDHYIVEARMKHKSGNWVWVLDTGKVVEWYSDGKPKRMIGTHIDITERMQYEHKLKLAKESAEKANKSKSQFLASMSHEIRTPMNGVIGMLEILKDTPLSKNQKHHIQLAEYSAHSLLNLINDILDFSKIDAGKLELECIDFDLLSLLSDFTQSTAIQAQKKGIEIILDTINIDTPMVKGDPGRLRQIITNIVGNAIKFTSEGEIIIHSDLEEVDDTHWQFKCKISDTGIGIPNDKIDSLFNSFSQVDASTTRKFGGTGLGLAIVKKLCHLMQGKVHVSSELNKGTCFTFYVMLKKSNVSQIPMPQVDIRKLHLLLVDSNSSNRKILRSQFESWGATIIEAESGEEAITICEQRANDQQQPFFDVAFIDMQLPNLNDAELGKYLSSDERFRKMKLVVMTSMGYKGEAHFLAKQGFSAYFPKPAIISDLINALKIVVDNGPAMQQATPLVTKHNIRSLERINETPEDDDSNLLKDKHILLVEDNPVNQIVAKGLLKKIGITHIDIAENGLEAINKINNKSDECQYHVILMDCQMPKMDGYEATRQIRSGQVGEINKSTVIIAMTANAMEGDRDKCLDVGMDDYLTKPINNEVLKHKLKKWLSTL